MQLDLACKSMNKLCQLYKSVLHMFKKIARVHSGLRKAGQLREIQGKSTNCKFQVEIREVNIEKSINS